MLPFESLLVAIVGTSSSTSSPSEDEGVVQNFLLGIFFLLPVTSRSEFKSLVYSAFNALSLAV